MEMSYLVPWRDLAGLREAARDVLRGGKGCHAMARAVVEVADRAEEGDPYL